MHANKTRENPKSEFAIFDETIANKVIRTLRKEIITKKIAPGSQITIKEIAERYCVSPMPVREAFRTLEGESLLEMHPHKGAVVQVIDARFIRETYAITCVLEAMLAQEAMARVTEEIARQLTAINTRIAGLLDFPERLGEYADLNAGFHDTINRYSSNQKAIKIVRYQQHLIGALRSYYIPSLEKVRAAVDEHADIIAALRSGDRYRVFATLEKHSQTALAHFLAQLDLSDESGTSS